MFHSNEPPRGLIRGGGLICKNDFLGGGLFEGGLFERRGLFEDLRYMYAHCGAASKQSGSSWEKKAGVHSI